MILNILASNSTNGGKNILISILSFILVFIVMGIIITAFYFISKLIDRSEDKGTEKKETVSTQVVRKTRNTNITDDDMMAAVLVATIDYRNEIKEDVRLVDVREIK